MNNEAWSCPTSQLSASVQWSLQIHGLFSVAGHQFPKKQNQSGSLKNTGKQMSSTLYKNKCLFWIQRKKNICIFWIYLFCFYKTNKFQKYKSLRGPTYFKIYINLFGKKKKKKKKKNSEYWNNSGVKKKKKKKKKKD